MHHDGNRQAASRGGPTAERRSRTRILVLPNKPAAALALAMAAAGFPRPPQAPCRFHSPGRSSRIQPRLPPSSLSAFPRHGHARLQHDRQEPSQLRARWRIHSLPGQGRSPPRPSGMRGPAFLPDKVTNTNGPFRRSISAERCWLRRLRGTHIRPGQANECLDGCPRVEAPRGHMKIGTANGRWSLSTRTRRRDEPTHVDAPAPPPPHVHRDGRAGIASPAVRAGHRARRRSRRAGAVWRHGLSLFGDLKYPAAFAHFDYVNPRAPKGGLVRQTRSARTIIST